MKWIIGCSGFHYREWKEVFYPAGLPQSKWFDHYSSQFNSIELNVTFYRFPQLSFLENWYSKSPKHFIFAVKAPRLITHYKKFTDSARLLKDFYTTCKKGLKDKLGSVLFQLPPGMIYTKEKLGLIVKCMNNSFDNVVEFRHESWWNKTVYAAFKKNNIAFCSISYPGLPNDVIATNKNIYYRFHGVPKLYYSAYKKEFLRKKLAEIMSKSVKNVFIYFNNTAGIGAISNAGYIEAYVNKFVKE